MKTVLLIFSLLFLSISDLLGQGKSIELLDIQFNKIRKPDNCIKLNLNYKPAKEFDFSLDVKENGKYEFQEFCRMKGLFTSNILTLGKLFHFNYFEEIQLFELHRITILDKNLTLIKMRKLLDADIEFNIKFNN